ncbi:GDSL-type esterase/lipase family protein [Calothrix sp. 336/3]|uniref:GDSL-type esterase/lipase family protein n=1 Tax=Calothrix sp. 336/3 TaxID=1337936 RepID=UPI000555A827|nr:GDSL-type esterase/lipase family protein [Calothrix sp. 336/3]AKG19933.1 G-D-S-L family lipolytic protein [Calothrix sp. 336/3]
MQTSLSPSLMQLSIRTTQCQPLKIVALGDSLVYGFGDPEGGGWVERLRRQWMAVDGAGHIIYNLGVRGDRVQQVAQRLEIEFRHRGELRNQVPNLIILSVGVNDSARLSRLDGKNYTDFSVFTAEINALVERAQQLCPVLFVGTVPVDEAKMPFLGCFHYNHIDQYKYKEVTRLACLERDIPYLDIFQLWMERGEIWRSQRLSADGLHPNTLGYQSLLEDVTNWDAFNKITKTPVSVGY